MFGRLLSATPAETALAIFAVAFATIAGAWTFQLLGFAPCDLCFVQRYAYYAGMPLALAVAALARFSSPSLVLRAGLAILALMFAANFVLAIYHSGVEMKLWQGPTACAASGANGPASAADLLTQLETVKVVRCDTPALRVFGLSLANWNALISAALAALGARAAWRSA